MTTIANYFEQAQLSLAAYALNLLPGMSGSNQTSDYINGLKVAGMSQKQAEEFANTYTVIAQSPPSLTGFSGTIFSKNGVNYFAIRGTEVSGYGVLDWIANLADVGPDGIAVSQGIAMFNWLQRLIANEGNAVVQYEYHDGPLVNGIYVPPSITTTTGTASGELYGQTGAMSVTGHSLGGHLAMMLSRLAPTLVNAVYTYNAPGFGGVVSEVLSALGVTANSISVTGIDNVLAQGGTSFTAGLGTLLGNVQMVFIEANLDPLHNHSIATLTDSLAIYDLFATIDPTLNTNATTGIQKITKILKASASTDSKTLENALDSLRTLFEQNYQDASANGLAAATAPDNRETFYTNLINLQATIKGLSWYNATPGIEALEGFSIQSLAGHNGASLAEAAQSDLAARYAVYKLNPFAVSGPGLYDVINTDHALDRYDPATRTGALSDEYLTDRGEFLARENVRDEVRDRAHDGHEERRREYMAILKEAA